MDQRPDTPTHPDGTAGVRLPRRRVWHRPVRPDVRARADGSDAADTWLRSAPLWARSALAAAGSAGVSAAIVVTVVFIGWMTAAYSTGTGGQATATGFAFWLLAHGVPLDAGFGPIVVVPWLLTLLPLVCCVWGAQWVVSSLPEEAGTRLPNLGGLRQDVAVALATFAVGYALASVLFALLARASALSPTWPATLLYPPVIALLGFAEALRYDAGAHLGSIAPRAAKAIRQRLPVWLGRSVRSGLIAAGALVAVGALIAIGLVPARWERVTAVFHTLHTGLVGGILLVLVTLLYAGTATMWVVSWLAGPGFSLGTDSSVTLTSVEPGQLPPVPLLGVLPEPGPLPGAMWLVILVPIGCGALAGYLGTRDLSRLSSWRLKAQAAGSSVATAVVVLTVLAALSSGSLGSGRLASVGIPVGWFALVITVELLAGAALAVGVMHRLRTRRIE